MRRRNWLAFLGLRSVKDLVHDDRGTVFLYFTVLSAVLAGFAGLSVDVGRLVATNTQAKSAADAAALAAATAMAAAVRAPGADPSAPQPVINAIWQAAQQGVSNRQSYATVTNGGSTTTGGTVQITNVRMLTSLPELNGGSSSTPVDAYVTSDPWEAKFVEVTTETLNQTNFFMAAVGSPRTTNTQARAVAGFTQVMCNITPLWICNPAEVNGPGSTFRPEEWRGRQIRLRSAAPGSAWSPGNFGLLDGPYGQSVPNVTRTLATAAPETCFRQDGVDLRPGQANPVVDGLNTRFDIYDSPHLSRSDPNYRPAQNVAKSLRFSTPACRRNQSTQTPDARMKRDSNLALDPDARLGNGVWDCLDYWNDNHPGVTPPAGCTNPSQMTRHELYLYEISTNNIINPNGLPQCYQGPTPLPSTPDRRIIYFAMINCSQEGLNGNRDDVPVAVFGKGFLTEDVPPPPNDEIYMEVVDVVRPGADDGVLHEIVQLYR